MRAYMFVLLCHNRFDTNGDEVLDLDEFTALVWAMDKPVDESDVLTMFQQALDLTAQGDRIAKVRERTEGGIKEQSEGQLSNVVEFQLGGEW